MDMNEKTDRRASFVVYNSAVEGVDSEQLGVGNILRGTAAKPLTIFEKKASLINAELDKFGMGRYQWYAQLCKQDFPRS